jgi:outer membrane protein assembly factor BamB
MAILPLIGAIILGGLSYYHDRTGSIDHPGGVFIAQAAPTLPKGAAQVDWPVYGYSKDHARFFPAPPSLRPPFRTAWTTSEHGLLEFPPVIASGRIFQLNDRGVLTAINADTGEVVWRRRVGDQAASTPAVEGETVLATVLKRNTNTLGGRVVALSWSTGQLLWQRDLPAPSESSPMVDDGEVFFGSQDGTVYALRTQTGELIWTYHAAGAVKASPTLVDGRLIFGDYAGRVQAISEATGRPLWIAQTHGTLFGSGTFYSTAAVDYGRVFLGNTDGRVYAFDEHSGRLDWAHQTGAYVYSAPAVTNAPGLGPTVFVGSYDGHVYALSARTGAERWSYDAGGRISGGITVVGRIAYFADLAAHRTIGLGISTGRRVFSIGQGSFDPIISDGRDLFLSGAFRLSALAPRSTPSRKPQNARPTAHPTIFAMDRRRCPAKPLTSSCGP